jgi:hypothetical protein
MTVDESSDLSTRMLALVQTKIPSKPAAPPAGAGVSPQEAADAEKVLAINHMGSHAHKACDVIPASPVHVTYQCAASLVYSLIDRVP